MDAMPEVNDGNLSMPPMVEICERYKKLYAGAVYDVLEGMGTRTRPSRMSWWRSRLV